MSEAELQRVVTDAAKVLGWWDFHIRPARTAHGWSVPISGSLGQGWPDLTLVHPSKHRTLALELKSEKGHVTAEQLAVHAVLVAAGWEVRVIRPGDIDDVLEVLRA